MSNPPILVQQHGQSIWVDNIRRKLLNDGTFRKLIDEQGVVGVTSNPAIFQQAIGESDDYDDAIRELLDLDAEAIYERLAVADIQQACDLFRPVYDRTEGRDGYVSLEVSPHLAHDTEGTVAEAARLFAEVDRPNVMIKIPATQEGIPAVQQTIAAGINVNITLIFAVSNYLQVAEAYISGLEQRLAAGDDVSKIASVASFFLSRIDTMVDQALENNIQMARVQGDTARVSANEHLLGKAATANAQLAYLRFKELFYSTRFERLREAGAMVQRPLWASTSTKNPRYPDTKYVDALIGADTVNTVPPKTLDAFTDHGTVADTLDADQETIMDILDRLAELGVDMAQVTQRLQDDGVDAFAHAFDDLLEQVEAKRTVLRTGVIARQKLALGVYANDIERTTAQLDNIYFNSRIWHRDGSLWKDHGPTINRIENRLGWLSVEDTIDRERLKRLQEDMRGNRFEHVVLLGMGGSSLAPEVLSKTFGQQTGFPALIVLDNTHPEQIQAIEAQIDIHKTLFIVSSKSGTTTETLAFFQYFFDRANENGAQFIAITDPESPLVELARQHQFRDTFVNPADIGGRYSALSYFGLVPAALTGLDIDRLWRAAETMIAACGPTITHRYHPGITLGAILGTLAKKNRDKLVVFASDEIASFGDWAEQLIAESTGKENQGIVPVVGTTIGRPHDFENDRVFVYLKLDGADDNDEKAEKIKALREAGHPRIVLSLRDKYDLAGEFFRWEYATAVCGHLQGINPFDEPNVTESKDITRRILSEYESQGTLPAPAPVLRENGIQLFAGEPALEPLREFASSHAYNGGDMTELIAAQIAGTHIGDYFAVLVYAPSRPEINAKVLDVRRRLRHTTRRAVTAGYGPRYLHSTGQLHKGGSNEGIFFLLTDSPTDDITIPSAPYSFGTLVQAQAAGDFEALQNHKRRAFRLHGDIGAALDQLLAAIAFVEERKAR